MPVGGVLALVAGLAGLLPVALVLIVVGLAVTGYGTTIAWSAMPTRTRRGRRRQGVSYVAAGMVFSGVSTVAAGGALGVAPDAYSPTYHCRPNCR